MTIAVFFASRMWRKNSVTVVVQPAKSLCDFADLIVPVTLIVTEDAKLVTIVCDYYILFGFPDQGIAALGG
jgi:hypothetical protein